MDVSVVGMVTGRQCTPLFAKGHILLSSVTTDLYLGLNKYLVGTNFKLPVFIWSILKELTVMD